MKKLILLSALLSLISTNSIAQESCDLFFKNGRFDSHFLKANQSSGCSFEIKAHQKNRITFCNLSDKAVEFESHDLKIEKVVGPNKSATIRFKPLEKNKFYDFQEEFSKTKCKFKGV